MPTYKEISKCHRDYAGRRQALLAKMHVGGDALLGDVAALREVLRQNINEPDDQFDERAARAVYPNHVGGVVDDIGALVESDPLRVRVRRGEVNGKAEASDDEAPGGFWAEFLRHVGEQGAEERSFGHYMGDQLLDAMVKGVAYAQADLPGGADPGEVYTLAQEESAGQRRAYLVRVDPECVINWGDAEDSSLAWALIHSVDDQQASASDNEETVVETFRELGAGGYRVWQIRYSKKVYPAGPPPDAPVDLVEEGNHSFGRCPLLRWYPPPGLWVMDRLCSLQADICRGATNRSWLRDKVNVPMAYRLRTVLKDGEINPASKGQQKSRSGVQRIYEGLERDKFGFLQPDPAALEHNTNILNSNVAELYRSANQMARSSNDTGAAIGRSGESKGMDAANAATVARRMGIAARRHALAILRLVEAGRRDAPQPWVVTGYEQVEVQTAEAASVELEGLELVKLPPTARVELIVRWFRKKFPDATPAMLATVREEAEAMCTVEQQAGDAEAMARAKAAEHAAKNPGASGKAEAA